MKRNGAGKKESEEKRREMKTNGAGNEQNVEKQSRK